VRELDQRAHRVTGVDQGLDLREPSQLRMAVVTGAAGALGRREAIAAFPRAQALHADAGESRDRADAIEIVVDHVRDLYRYGRSILPTRVDVSSTHRHIDKRMAAWRQHEVLSSRRWEEGERDTAPRHWSVASRRRADECYGPPCSSEFPRRHFL